MTEKIPPKDLERIEYTARVLRLAHPRLHTKSDLTEKQLKAYAAMLLNECEACEWPLPEALKLLIIELLLDVSVKSPGAPVHPLEDLSNEDLSGEHAKISELLMAETEKAIANVNSVGASKYWAAVDYEASQPDDLSGREPSKATVSAVAQNSGATRDTVKRWRKDAAYRENVKNRRANREARN